MKGSASKTEITRRDPATVLIAVSDESTRTLYVESLLFFTNYRVVEAVTGPDAIEKIRRLRPKVAILSMGLRGLDGWTEIRALKRDAATREVRLVVVSVHDDGNERRSAEDVGVDELIALPLLADELVDIVKRSVMVMTSSSRTPPSARRPDGEEPRSPAGRNLGRERGA